MKALFSTAKLREKGVVFCGGGDGCCGGFLRKRRQPKSVEKKRREKEKGVDFAWCRREEEKEEKEEDKLTVSYEIPEVLVPVATAVQPVLENLLRGGLERFAKLAESTLAD
ncbi:hypothetical protein OIU74_011508 [Salix koriyanagi]|uniref:Uncharacterized protein n=1 Tax=Salix koriyanagi TaxID=2511006 RepID=A0A9Q0YUJ1_9ROSI|nr:hypothetical protein OIU74_011508 [Salix koriyanagi]